MVKSAVPPAVPSILRGFVAAGKGNIQLEAGKRLSENFIGLGSDCHGVGIYL
jgi:hypothetical protein